MNDYREVGDLSVRAMLFPERKRNPIPAITAGPLLFPDSSTPSRMGLLTERLPCDNALLRVRDAMGLTVFRHSDTKKEGALYGPTAYRPCPPTHHRRNLLYTLLASAYGCIYGRFLLTVRTARVHLGSPISSAWPPARLMLAGPSRASRFGKPMTGRVRCPGSFRPGRYQPRPFR